MSSPFRRVTTGVVAATVALTSLGMLGAPAASAYEPGDGTATNIDRASGQQALGAAATTTVLAGAGTVESPYLLGTEAELLEFIALVNVAGGPHATAHFALSADITLRTPIDMVTSFAGVLDGAGHTIRGLRVKVAPGATNKSAAFFGELRGTVRHLGLAAVAITGDASLESQTTGTRRAALVLDNRGVVERVRVQGLVAGGWRTGGIAVDNHGTIRDSVMVGHVEGSWETGGIVARSVQNAGAVTTRNLVRAEVRMTANNGAMVIGDVYKDATVTDNVVLSGSMTGVTNTARVVGRVRDLTPTLRNNLVLDTVTHNGSVPTTDLGHSARNGAQTAASALADQSTYTAIGWDFDTVWAWNAEQQRPMLRGLSDVETDESGEETVKVQIREISSPDGRTTAILHVDDAGMLGYSVERDGAVVVKDSELGLTVDQVNLGAGVTLAQATEYAADETYPLKGFDDQGRDHHRGIRVPVQRGGVSDLTVDLRVFDTGVALQYVLDDSLAGATVSAEHTTFEFAPSSKITYQQVAAGTIDDLQGTWTRSDLSAIGDRQITVLPTVELPGDAAVVNVAEANIRDWPALALNADSTGRLGTYYWATDAKDGSFKVAEETLHSPWRVITIGDDLDQLLSSDIVTAVSDEMDADLFTDADEWIDPGTSVWMPLNGAGHASSPQAFRTFIDASAEAGIDYVLVEDISTNLGWGATTEEKFGHLKELVQYGEQHGVRVWLWSDYDFGNGTDAAFRDAIDFTTDFADKDSLQNPDFRDAYLDLVVETGIAGLKIDHLNEETETKVNFYADFNGAAAQRRLMTIYHNPLAPSGLERTYPNELGREAIRGVQHGYNAHQNTLMPFTRLVAGTADYTPLTFSNAGLGGNVSWVHQMASAIVYTAPYLQITEVPTTVRPGGKYEAELGDFLRNIPTEWDDLTVLPESRIGSLAAFVRKTTDNEWYVAAQAGSDGARDLEVALDFLPDGVTYNADVYTDGATPTSVKRETLQVDNTSVLDASLLNGGGYVVRITTDEIDNPIANPESYEIGSVADLDLIRQHPAGNFTLTADLQLDDTFQPLEYLRGTLDGAGHKISGLDLQKDGSTAFLMENAGTVKNLGFVGPRVTKLGSYSGSHRVATAVLVNRGVVENVHATDGDVRGGWRSGGLVAENQGTVRNAYFTGKVHANWESGGITAWNSASGQVINTYAKADVTAVANNYGVVSGYGYTGTIFRGNVALGGSLTGVANPGRINGQHGGGGMPTYVDNVALNSIAINGNLVVGAATDRNGRDATTEQLADVATWTGIGFDFDTVWAWSADLGRPVLLDVEEQVLLATPTLTSELVFSQVGATLDADKLLADLGAAAVDAELRIDTSDVDTTVAGTYPVRVTAHSGDRFSLPVKAFLQVVEAIAITVEKESVSYPRGTQLDAAKVLADLGADTTVRGTVEADLSAVDTGAAGSYPVRLSATDRHGFAAEDRTVTVEIRETVTPPVDKAKKPGAAKIRSLKSTRNKIVITWRAAEANGARITSYQVKVGNRTITVGPNKRRVVVKGLKAKQKYVVRLRAFNALGAGKTTHGTVRTR